MTTIKTYDYLNRLTSIANQAGTSLPVSYQYTYNTANQRIRMAFSDGSYWVYTYDAMGQVTSGKRYWSDGQPVAGQQFEYGYDDIGNRTHSKDGGDANGQNLRETTYTSNAWNQYTNRVNPGLLNVLGVANVGAAVTVNSLATTRRGEYFYKELAVANTLEQYVSVTVDSDQTPPEPTGKRYVPKQNETLNYDTDGNLVTDGRWTYTWDAENRLIKLERDAGSGNALSQKLEFDYDSSGRRIRKRFYTKPSTVWALQSDRVYLYDGWNLVAEAIPNTSGSTGWAQGYVWGTDLSGTMTGAGGVGGLLMVHYNSSAGTQFVGMDGNGNVVGTCATDGNGWTSRYEYGPFGETIRGSGVLAKSNPFRFSTKFTDNESGLVYYGYRYYSEELGRWVSRDPIYENGSINIINFVNNNSVNYVDFLGLLFQDNQREIVYSNWSLPVFLNGHWVDNGTLVTCTGQTNGVAVEGQISVSASIGFLVNVPGFGEDLEMSAGYSITATIGVSQTINCGGKGTDCDPVCYKGQSSMAFQRQHRLISTVYKNIIGKIIGWDIEDEYKHFGFKANHRQVLVKCPIQIP